MVYIILLVTLAGIVYGADFLVTGSVSIGFVAYTWYLVTNQIA